MVLPYGQTEDAFQAVARFLRDNQRELTGIATTKKLGTGASDVLTADLQAERRLVPDLCKLWVDVPVLCEEAGNSNLSDLVPGVDILPWGDDVVDLPPMFMSV